VALDDYKFRNMDKIVGVLAHQFEPGRWTDEVKPVKADDSPAEETTAAAEGTSPDDR
jgi:hypothetical protein